jgi:hypothetical protein
MSLKDLPMRILFTIFLALLISGCSSLKVATDYDPSADLTSPKNFSIVHKALEGEDTLTSDRIIAAIKTELIQKGYKETSRDVNKTLFRRLTLYSLYMCSKEPLMSNWFDRLFNHSTATKPLLHHFGRSINAQLHPNEHQLFTQASEAFQEDKIVEAYELYLRSLENFNGELSNENVEIHYEDKTLHFRLDQGTAVIHGVVTDKTFEAHSVMFAITPTVIFYNSKSISTTPP